MTDDDFLADMRSRINPAYADTRGTESWERKRALEVIDRLTDELAESAEDARLLDWLIDNCVKADPDMSGKHHWFIRWRNLRGETFRDAIRAAIAAEEAKPLPREQRIAQLNAEIAAHLAEDEEAKRQP